MRFAFDLQQQYQSIFYIFIKTRPRQKVERLILSHATFYRMRAMLRISLDNNISYHNTILLRY